ncbi:MAG: hypothetical protein K0S08_1971 [Gammaproteobacteria bacterium]|jgi:hypothetical protein|nr:hypothetical protein [Gammaproteobacteria bacterium]
MKIGMKALLVSSLLLSMGAAYADGKVTLLVDQQATSLPGTVTAKLYLCSDTTEALKVDQDLSVQTGPHSQSNSATGNYTAGPGRVIVVAEFTRSNANDVPQPVYSTSNFDSSSIINVSFPTDFAVGGSPNFKSVCPSIDKTKMRYDQRRDK